MNSFLAKPQTNPGEEIVTTKEMAARYGRTRKTIIEWCKDGTLVEFGFRAVQDLKRHWWIVIPPSGN